MDNIWLILLDAPVIGIIFFFCYRLKTNAIFERIE